MELFKSSIKQASGYGSSRRRNRGKRSYISKTIPSSHHNTTTAVAVVARKRLILMMIYGISVVVIVGSIRVVVTGKTSD